MTDQESGVPASPLQLQLLPLAELRSRRQDLLEECTRLARWRRLLQSRMDLAVDAAAPVDDLSCAPSLLRDGLCELVRGGAPTGGDPVEHLQRVDRARTELAWYTAAVRTDLGAATDELVARYTVEPARCLTAPPQG